MFKGATIVAIVLVGGLSVPAAGAEAPSGFEPFKVLLKDPRGTMKRVINGQPAVPEHAAPAATPAKADPVTAVGAQPKTPAAAVPTPRARPASAATAPAPAPVPATPPVPAATPDPDPQAPPIGSKLAFQPEAPDIVLPPPRPQIAAAIANPPNAKPNPGPEVAALSPSDKSAVADCGRSLASLGINAVPLAPIHEGACGVAAPAAIASLDGGAVTLTEKAIVNCAVAGALAKWMDDEVAPAAKKILGGDVTAIRIAASYDCRSRNHVAGAQLSEHAFGNALDISGFKIAGLGWVEVGHTKTTPQADFMAAVRKDACGPFTTVLGPGQPYHDEHLHLDLAKRGKNGQSLYCK